MGFETLRFRSETLEVLYYETSLWDLKLSVYSLVIGCCRNYETSLWDLKLGENLRY